MDRVVTGLTISPFFGGRMANTKPDLDKPVYLFLESVDNLPFAQVRKASVTLCDGTTCSTTSKVNSNMS